ncbi:restriction endonuclease subunit S [Tenacibaculum maritimum]|uniref:restriction endonuclease subunit S n=1 Tax=Tenacibaculum maritimum TaxID=107401 RepID=UPI003876E616
MEKYNEYKNSGIEWLGKIPKHWELDRVKNIGTVRARVGWKALKASEYVKSGYFFLSTPNIKYVNIDYENVNYITEERYYESPEIMLKNGDILLVKDGSTLGIVNIVQNLKKEGTVNSSIGILRLKKQYSKYFFYFFKSNYLQNIIGLKKEGMGVPHLFQKDINNFILTIPSLKEQTQIANYLDAKTTAIDKKITLLEQKIRHYRAYRKMVINEIVTKGLENDFSKWVSCRLKDIGYLYSGLSGKSGNDFNQDDNPNNRGFIPFTNIANNTYLDQNHLGTVVIEEKEKQNQVRKNDIFFLMSSEGYEDIGKSAVLIEDIEETYLNSFCKGFRITNKNCEASFINYLLFSDSYRQKMLVEGKGFTRINLKMEKVNNFSILIPPTKKEQQQIADYLDTKTTTIDKIINNIEAQITMLKELRKTLINEVVTGKVKVTSTSLSHQKASNQPIV